MILSVAENTLSSFSFPRSLIEIMSFWKKSFIFEPFIEAYIQTILMDQSDLTVRRIKDGTVIDHINVGSGLKVLKALQIDGSDGNVITIALNVLVLK